MSDTIGHLRTIGVTPSTFERIRLDYHGEFLIDLIEVSEEEIDDITEQWFAPFNDWVGRIGQLVDAHAPRTFWNAAIDALGYFLDEANRQIRQFNLLAQEEAKEEQMERRRKKNFTPWASSYYDEQEIPEHWRPSPLSPRRQPMSRNWNRRVSFDSPFLSQTDMGYWNHGNGMEHTVTTPPDTQSRYECSPDYMHGERSSSRPLSSAGSENQPTQPLSPTQGISNITTTSNSNNGVTTTQTTNLNVSPNIQMPINITVTIDSVPGEQTVNNYITVKPNINMPMHLNGSIREWTTENHYTGIGSKNPEVSHNEHEAGTVLTPSPDSENLLKRRRADSCDSDLPVPSTENEENHCTGCVCSFRAKRQRSSSFDESSRPSTPTERDLKARMLKLSEYQNPTIIGRKGSFQIPNIFPSLFLASLGRNDTRLKGGPSVKIATDEHFDFDHPDESIDEGMDFNSSESTPEMAQHTETNTKDTKKSHLPSEEDMKMAQELIDMQIPGLCGIHLHAQLLAGILAGTEKGGPV
ncbi:hypothetical protein M501DRAFT_1013919 [Patellaria atrata CBS 101060]|uniref:Uncharacterized protein n=1 Tax=Patellaria atrata CBS 101060 TaxID=1346257 RepID=A0A9P4SEC0_9PEZI|nr:hypothetical protein M501DRAFT_1013919 [Patellaria atrata CBS 101060]